MWLFDWLLGLFAKLGLRNRKARILLLGLDNAGKTTCIHKLRFGEVRAFVPTHRARSETFTIGNTEFTAWDLGGHEAVRELWSDYFTEVEGIVFVVDSADRARLPEAQRELAQVLKAPALANTPIVILGNKSDKAETASREELIAYLQLSPEDLHTDLSADSPIQRSMNIFKCSMLEGTGVHDALKWLVDAIGAV